MAESTPMYREQTDAFHRGKVRGMGKIVKGEWEAQTSIYEINKTGEKNVQHWEYCQWYCNNIA